TTRTGDPTTSPPGGTWSTGPRSRDATRRPAASALRHSLSSTRPSPKSPFGGTFAPRRRSYVGNERHGHLASEISASAPPHGGRRRPPRGSGHRRGGRRRRAGRAGRAHVRGAVAAP